MQQLQRALQEANLEVAALRRNNSEQVRPDPLFMSSLPISHYFNPH